MTAGHAPTLNSWTGRHRRSSDDGEADPFVSSGVLLAIVNAGGADGDAGEPFWRELDRTLSAGATRVLVDLSRAGDVTTRCMNSLLAARQRLFGRGEIAVVLSSRMRHRFETLGLERRFLLADSRLQAVRLLGLGEPDTPRTGAPRPHHAHAA